MCEMAILFKNILFYYLPRNIAMNSLTVNDTNQNHWADFVLTDALSPA